MDAPDPALTRLDRVRESPRAPLVVLGVGLVVATIELINQTRRLWFFGDEFTFLLNRTITPRGLFEPHNEHWVTLPLIVWRAMFHVFGIDHHLAYAMAPVILHLAICVALFIVMRRHGIGAWSATSGTLLLAFLCGGLAENPTWAFQITFLGSAFFGLLAILAWDGVAAIRLRYALVWILMVGSMMCSGMALPMLLLLGCVILFSRGLVSALLATMPPFVVYLVWYVTFGHDAVKQAPPSSVHAIEEFTVTGIANLWQQVILLPSIGGSIFAALVVSTLVVPLEPRVRQLAQAGLATTVATYLFVGVSRAGLGVDASTASRYAYFGLLFTLPAAAAVVGVIGTKLRARPLERVIVYSLLVAFVAVTGVTQTRAYVDDRVALTPGIRDRTLAAAQLVKDGAPLLNQSVVPIYAPDLTTAQLARTEVQDALPDAAPTAQGLLDAAAVLQVAAAPTSFGLAPPATVTPHAISGDLRSTGCSQLVAAEAAWIDVLGAPGGVQLTIQSQATALPAQLVRHDLLSAPVTLQAGSLTPTYIATTAQDAVLRVFLQPGPVKICR